jgi:hypothetical protein
MQLRRMLERRRMGRIHLHSSMKRWEHPESEFPVTMVTRVRRGAVLLSGKTALTIVSQPPLQEIRSISHEEASFAQKA